MNKSSGRSGFSLLELILALALSVLATAIIGSLVQMYSSNFATRGEDIRRVALARSILNMIADDIRGTVVIQEFDTSVLQQMLMGGGASSGGASGGGQSSGGQDGGSEGGGQAGQGAGQGAGQAGGQGGGSQGGAGQGTGQNQNANNSAAGGAGSQNSQGNRGGGGGQNQNQQGQQNRQGGMGGGGTSVSGGSGTSGGGASGGAAGQSGSGTGEEGATAEQAATSTALPLGVYGSQTRLTLDVSRLPRPDEYTAIQASIMSGELTDVPGDVKSVSYFVQMPTNMGVTDKMNAVTSTPENGGMVGGLVRQQIDRGVLAVAEEQGQSQQLMRTGDLVAPEVISLEYLYYDGTQWLTTWDSSTQGLPWLIEISLAMQTKTGERQGVVTPGTSISMMPLDQRSLYGVEVYMLTVAIPGAQLQTLPASATGTDGESTSGMSAVGL